MAHATKIVFHFVAPSLSTITGHTTTGGIAPSTVTCHAYGLGANALSQPISWPVANFTGLTVPSTSTSYQRGINNGWYGSTSCQVAGTQMGFQVHKDSGEDPNPTGGIYGMHYAYGWSDFSIHPWSDSYGSTAQLRLQNYYAVQSRDGHGVIQYGQITVSLVDTVHLKSIWFSISMWDSRGIPPEGVLRDTGGTTNYNVVTYFGDSLRYSNRHFASQKSDGTGSGLWYAAYISRTNLVNAVTDINRAFGENYSTNPNDYAVNFISSGTEMYSPSGTTGWIASRVWDIIALTEY